MKNYCKLKAIQRIAGIIALVGVIGFSMTACGKKSGAEAQSSSRAETSSQTGTVAQPTSANANPGDFGYIRNENGNGVIVTYITANAASVVIPDTIDNLPVVDFRASVFGGNKTLRSVTIPATVTTIPNEAFRDCENLTTVNLKQGTTAIGAGAFRGCESLTSITLPVGVSTIGNNAFYNCKNLASVTANTGLISIGSGTFSGCENLTKVTLPDGLTTIGGLAFNGCINLTDISIPASLSTFPNQTDTYNFPRNESRAFNNCHKLPVTTRNKIIAQGYDGKGF